ncbi:VWA domain-containing protein [Acidipila rosea]|uniref:VWFA-related protein n=1 Tax=Acidipila rosea TaxID=768535 RepID=A0A4R1LBJ0_9BACT|nr:VWA domain-containing protein [Acidipila rosea]TCK75838.1 VWFA-related protein [Acidipila rosea]
MRYSRRLALAVCTLSVSATLATAQVAAAAPKSSVPITAPVSTAGTLDLDVVVSGHNGKPISGLQQQDFTVYMDKKQQPITSFRAVEATATSAAPIETILLIDTVNTRFSNVAYERQQVDQFLKRNNGKLSQPITLVILGDKGIQITPQASRDGNQLAAFLDKAEIAIRDIGREAGFYGWTEEFQLSASGLERLAAYEQTRPGRKLLIWISPGWPLLSGPEVELSYKDQEGLFASLVGLSASLRKARITLSSVDPLGTADGVSYRTTFYEEFTKGVPSAKKMQIGNLALQVLALQSGGRVLNSNNDVAGEIATAASDADAFYILKINSPAAEHPNDYRDISVKVDKPGLTARTRTGYYAQP